MATNSGPRRLMDLLLCEHFLETKFTGSLKVERVLGKSTATRSYATYPLQFMIPKKAIPSTVDAVVVFSLTFGGGLVSGDCITIELDVRADCTMSLLTQGYTNIYKSVEGKISRQMLKCSVASGGFLALLPDAIVCFSTARYSQVQSFDLAPDANLVLVDWLTSGRIARGEIWDFDLFKSTNHIYIQGDKPLLLDSVCLEKGVGPSILERMGDYHVIALIVIYGPRLAELRRLVRLNVGNLANVALNSTRVSKSSTGDQKRAQWSKQTPSLPTLFTSCSNIGVLDEGLVVRVASTSTILLYRFLREQLAPLRPMIGMLPYADR